MKVAKRNILNYATELARIGIQPSPDTAARIARAEKMKAAPTAPTTPTTPTADSSPKLTAATNETPPRPTAFPSELTVEVAGKSTDNSFQNNVGNSVPEVVQQLDFLSVGSNNTNHLFQSPDREETGFVSPRRASSRKKAVALAAFGLETPRKGTRENPSLVVIDLENNHFNRNFHVNLIKNHVHNRVKHDLFIIRVVPRHALDYKITSMWLASACPLGVPLSVLDRSLLVRTASVSYLMRDPQLFIKNIPAKDGPIANALLVELQEEKTTFEANPNLEKNHEYSLLVFPVGTLFDNSIHSTRGPQVVKRRAAMKVAADADGNFFKKEVKGGFCAYFKIAKAGGTIVNNQSDEEDKDSDFDV